MGLGPILSTAVEEWWDRYGYADDLREWFWSVMMLVDGDTLQRVRQSAK